jgi:hypothetical protein
MSMYHSELARALMAEHEHEILAHARRRQARLTRQAAKRPVPAGRREPGLLARLVPWFGGHVRTA